MRLKAGRWYSNFRWEGNNIEVSLDAYEEEETRATVNLGRLIENLVNGVNPTSLRKPIARLRYPKKDVRGQRIWELHIQPFFGSYKIPEVTGESIERYISHRWGSEAPQSTAKFNRKLMGRWFK